MNEEGTLIIREPSKRSNKFEKNDFYNSEVKLQAPLERSYRSVIKMPFKKISAKLTNTKVLQKSA